MNEPLPTCEDCPLVKALEREVARGRVALAAAVSDRAEVEELDRRRLAMVRRGEEAE